MVCDVTQCTSQTILELGAQSSDMGVFCMCGLLLLWMSRIHPCINVSEWVNIVLVLSALKHYWVQNDTKTYQTLQLHLIIRHHLVSHTIIAAIEMK